MRPNVPYAIVAESSTAQTPVMMPPIGKMRILVPGRTNGASEATTRVWMGAVAWKALVAVTAKTPVTKEASPVLRVVLTAVPVAEVAVRVTMGTTSFSREALRGVG